MVRYPVIVLGLGFVFRKKKNSKILSGVMSDVTHRGPYTLEWYEMLADLGGLEEYTLLVF
jgi:hypothetical protein